MPWCLKAIGDHVYARQYRKRLEVLVSLKWLFEVSEGLEPSIWTSQTICLISWGKDPVIMQVNEGTGVAHHPVTSDEDCRLRCFAYCPDPPLLQPISLWEEVTAACQSHCPGAPETCLYGCSGHPMQPCVLPSRKIQAVNGDAWCDHHLKFWIVSSYRSLAPPNSLYTVHSFTTHQLFLVSHCPDISALGRWRPGLFSSLI